jgi:hypothetical protein
LKNKVAFNDFPEKYKSFSGVGYVKLNVSELKKIKELDEKISKLDFLLVKEIMKAEKE